MPETAKILLFWVVVVLGIYIYAKMQPEPYLDQGYDPNKNYPKTKRERVDDSTPEGCAYNYGMWVCEQEIGGSCWCDY